MSDINEFIMGEDIKGYSIVDELRRAYIEGWISKEDLLDALQRGRISQTDYMYILGDRPNLSL